MQQQNTNTTATISTFPTWRNFVKTSALFITVGSLLTLHSSCGGGEDFEEVLVTDTVKTVELTQGVITTLKETKAGEFIIEKEDVVSTKDSSRVIVNYLDGRTETLTLAQVASRINPQDSAAIKDTTLHATNDGKTTHYNPGYSSGMHTFGYVLMGGMMGYFLGKSLAMPPNPNVYRNPQQTYYNTRSMSGTGGTYTSGGRTYTYSGNNGYSSLQQTSKTTYTPRTTTVYKSVSSGKTYTSRPSSYSGRSSGGGYSG